MLQEKLTDALINKARQENNANPKSSRRTELEAKLDKATSDVMRSFYGHLLRLEIRKKPERKATQARPAYRVAKAQGYSTKRAGQIGLAFLSYARGGIDFHTLCNNTGLSEADIMNHYREAL